jgi:hypothetical protein
MLIGKIRDKEIMRYSRHTLEKIHLKENSLFSPGLKRSLSSSKILSSNLSTSLT